MLQQSTQTSYNKRICALQMALKQIAGLHVRELAEKILRRMRVGAPGFRFYR
jgi:hypothetical protein